MNNDLIITFILTPVDSCCNLACDYCYYGNKKPKRFNVWNELTTKNVLDAVVHIAKKLKPKGKVRVKIYWHGGEPLLAGIEYFKKALLYQQELEKNYEVVFANVIQSNGTLIDDNYASFLVNHKFGVGISFDGIPSLHDLHRKYVNGKGTSKRVIQAVKLLQKYGKVPGIVCVVTSDSIGYEKQIYQFLKYELNVNHVAISPQTDLKSQKPAISPDEYANFMISLFNIWLEDDDPSFRIRELESWIKLMFGGKSKVCVYSPKVCGSYMTINYDLTLSYCDEYGSLPSFRIGAIECQDIDSLIADHSKLRKSIFEKRSRCISSSCKYTTICFGGCPKHWYNGVNYFCSAYRKIFSVIEDTIKFV